MEAVCIIEVQNDEVNKVEKIHSDWCEQEFGSRPLSVIGAGQLVNSEIHTSTINVTKMFLSVLDEMKIYYKIVNI
ncbi:hypothetical protein A4U49_01445 [Acidithiobacillus ferrivorans]|jgi:hypothetical protein|uniref:hypothetical protein n=1 Tax=Acidithiobacillus ferrivorans TaxID=160808 RepID=UPI000893B918|nr:hypothetical protein [Acidithiobacillus ferrivorans]OFA17550.1 hypothetical protein A4U49_01445 [Acidithiobacillus ferrivorans]